MSNSLRPHRRQPTSLPRPWDSPGKNTGAGCHFLLQCMKVKSEREVAQSCPTLRNPIDVTHQDPPSMGFSRQEYWSGVPSPINISQGHVIGHHLIILIFYCLRCLYQCDHYSTFWIFVKNEDTCLGPFGLLQQNNPDSIAYK